MESRCEDLVRMGWVYLVTKLLNLLHLDIIEDLNIWLCAGHYESPAIIGIVDGMELIVLIEHDSLDGVSHG